MTTDYLLNKENIEVADLLLASYLQYLEFPVTTISRDPKEHPKVGFIFKKTSELDRAVSDFWDGQVLVEPKRFWGISRELKNRIRTIS